MNVLYIILNYCYHNFIANSILCIERSVTKPNAKDLLIQIIATKFINAINSCVYACAEFDHKVTLIIRKQI